MLNNSKLKRKSVSKRAATDAALILAPSLNLKNSYQPIKTMINNLINSNKVYNNNEVNKTKFIQFYQDPLKLYSCLSHKYTTSQPVLLHRNLKNSPRHKFRRCKSFKLEHLLENKLKNKATYGNDIIKIHLQKLNLVNQDDIDFLSSISMFDDKLDSSGSYAEIYLKESEQVSYLLSKCALNKIEYEKCDDMLNLNNLIFHTSSLNINLDSNEENTLSIRLVLQLKAAGICDTTVIDEEAIKYAKRKRQLDTPDTSLDENNNMGPKRRRLEASWSNMNMKAALNAIKEENLSLIKASKLFQVPISIISFYLKNNTEPNDCDECEYVIVNNNQKELTKEFNLEMLLGYCNDESNDVKKNFIDQSKIKSSGYKVSFDLIDKESIESANATIELDVSLGNKIGYVTLSSTSSSSSSVEFLGVTYNSGKLRAKAKYKMLADNMPPAFYNTKIFYKFNLEPEESTLFSLPSNYHITIDEKPLKSKFTCPFCCYNTALKFHTLELLQSHFDKFHLQFIIKQKQYPMVINRYEDNSQIYLFNVWLRDAPVIKSNESVNEKNGLIDKLNRDRPSKSRKYFSSKTNQLKTPAELDVDSEDDVDEWIKESTTMMLNEFSDVNSGEKEFMKLWNFFLLRKPCVADTQLLRTCLMFVQEEGSKIFELNLYKNFMLHLASMNDYRLLRFKDLIKITDLLEVKEVEFKKKQEILLI